MVTKLDGTAKGGVLAAIAQERPIPVYFIGVGEKLEDLEKTNDEDPPSMLLIWNTSGCLRLPLLAALRRRWQGDAAAAGGSTAVSRPGARWFHALWVVRSRNG